MPETVMRSMPLEHLLIREFDTQRRVLQSVHRRNMSFAEGARNAAGETDGEPQSMRMGIFPRTPDAPRPMRSAMSVREQLQLMFEEGLQQIYPPPEWATDQQDEMRVLDPRIPYFLQWPAMAADLLVNAAATPVTSPRRRASASDALIERLPLHTHAGAAVVTCPVCLDDAKDGDSLRTLPCRHIFHDACVDRWLRRSATCPTCRCELC